LFIKAFIRSSGVLQLNGLDTSVELSGPLLIMRSVTCGKNHTKFLLPTCS